MAADTAETTAPTRPLLERMIASGMSEERARAHLEAGVVRVDGEYTRDGDLPLVDGARWLINP